VTKPVLTLSPAPPAARGLTEQDFNALYSAAAFAAAFDLFFDTSITLAWRLMGPEIEANVPTYLEKFLKCLRDWLTSRRLPLAWLYCHEHSPRIGQHTHVICFIPGVIGADRPPSATVIWFGQWLPGQEWIPARRAGPPPAPLIKKPHWHRVDYRGEFRAWARGWAEHQMKRPCPRAVRVRGPRTETPWLHWLTFSYLMKGYDRGIVVQSARHSPDGQTTYLGDLIAWPWRDPGPVPWRRRCGVSRSLGPDRRAVGVLGGLDYLLGKSEFPVVARPYPAFRSWYEDGCRDVRQLYPAEFYDKITKLPRLPPI
jgi:hypothetical protein